ncbi:MAG: carbohydrate binding family 9 domain-containing protein, partial [Candidatus Aminicenantes bacterium]|nr:carbohydrate binding family 9 domain-containing protein [Candidatus Aminicenantes bacterium]
MQAGRANPLVLTRAAAPIRIDGLLDDPAWEKAARLDIAYEWTPGENVPPPVKSEVLVTYDDSYFYVAFRCFDPEPKAIRAHLMDRDATDTLIQDDHISFMVDTFNDERRAFQFRVNPLGVQADAVFSEMEGYEDFSWDAIWKSAGRIEDFGYTIEVALPFNQLRFPSGGGVQTWGFEADRSYPRNVRHRMSTHPRDRNVNCILCQFNKITGFENISPGVNLQITPTLTATQTDVRPDFPDGPMESRGIKADPGLSLRWGLTPNLTFNAAVNPDFSQVEADVAQMDVNTRFALYYPEKRPFFLEAADFFLTPMQAVFTRSVADPLWGGKLTGKIGRGAMGFFAAQDRINNLVIPSNQGSDSASLENDVTSGVFRYRYDLGRGSTIGALYAGRTADEYHNHAGGLDGFFRLGNKDSLVFQFLRSDTLYPVSLAEAYNQPKGSFGGNAIIAQYIHRTRNVMYYASYESIDPKFRADSGYMPRVDTQTIDLEVDAFLYGVRGGGKSGKWFDQLRFWLRGYRTTDFSGRMTDARVALGASYSGPLQSQFTLLGRWNQEYYSGTLFDTSDIVAQLLFKPAGGMSFSLVANAAGAVDYANVRKARALRLGPDMEFGLGRHLNIGAGYFLERLADGGDRIYTAHLLQGRLIYNINTRMFLRLILQYQDIDRDPGMYGFPVSASSRDLFAQFLFSYKINPQTLLFLGYSDNSFGARGIDLVRYDRTLFFKIGYAWVM